MDNQRYKYPKTYHFPFSPGQSNDDKVIDNYDRFYGQEIVVLEKMDGENTTLYPDYLHARSIDGRHHPSRDWIKAYHNTFAYTIPNNWRICGENMYARHSIAYDNLDSYFYVFSIWENDFCMDWDFTCYICDMWHLTKVPVLYRGIFDEQKIKSLAEDMDLEKHEGFVVRLADGFLYSEFDRCVAKYVRKGHVQTQDHWQFQTIVPNKLKGQE